MTGLDLRNLASAGGNIIINGAEFTALDLRNAADAGRAYNTKLTIYGISKFTALDLKNIASSNPGNVTFDFSK